MRRGLAQFSLSRQRDARSIEFGQGIGGGGWGGMVFKGGRDGWAREPGSWGGRRGELLRGRRGVEFLEEVEKLEQRIIRRCNTWIAHPSRRRLRIAFLKRKWRCDEAWGTVGDEGRLHRPFVRRKEQEVSAGNGMKRAKTGRGEAGKVWTELWRCRRRTQERRRGRWLDGTIRQDQLWAGFHWVLDEYDPRDTKWARPKPLLREVEGGNMFGL